jgi:type VI secretion system protein ImpC
MADPMKAASAPEASAAELTLLDQIVEQGKLGRDAEQRSRGRDQVRRFVEEVLKGAMTVSRSTEAMIEQRIAQIDHLVSQQVTAILHHPEFQRLEGAWRGLHYLVRQTETSERLKLKVLNVSKRELLKDLQDKDWDQSALFIKVYEEE